MISSSSSSYHHYFYIYDSTLPELNCFFSSTEGAKDSRKRNEEKEKWQGMVRSIVDKDILKTSDALKGMNPAGRTLCAAYRMIQRLQRKIKKARLALDD